MVEVGLEILRKNFLQSPFNVMLSVPGWPCSENQERREGLGGTSSTVLTADPSKVPACCVSLTGLCI